ncbi:MAG TPA: hypothetical protein PKD83_00180 [Ignavibacteria bacterium]|nr:hypothetical protein [Ignavibacteria bacterium]
MRVLTLILFFILMISGCTKVEDKKSADEKELSGKEIPGNQNSQSNTQSNVNSQKESSSGMNSDYSKGNNSGNSTSENTRDEKAEEMEKIANAVLTDYKAGNFADNKETVITTLMEAANYLMFQSTLPPKQKYKPALNYYNKILEIDPKNEEALANKKQIEEIYESMGMPVPK